MFDDRLHALVDAGSFVSAKLVPYRIEILPGDDHVAVLKYATAKRKDRLLDMDCCTVYRLHEGKITEMNVLPFDAAAWDEFWS